MFALSWFSCSSSHSRILWIMLLIVLYERFPAGLMPLWFNSLFSSLAWRLISNTHRSRTARSLTRRNVFSVKKWKSKFKFNLLFAFSHFCTPWKRQKTFGFTRNLPKFKCNWNHTSAWVFSCKFVAYFKNTFS